MSRQFQHRDGRQIPQDGLTSAQRVLRAAADAEKAGTVTLRELAAQQDSLDRAENKLDAIEADMKITNRQLGFIESWFGGWSTWWGATTSKPVEVEDDVLDEDGWVLIEKPAGRDAGDVYSSAISSSSRAGIQSKKKAPQDAQGDKAKAFKANLQRLKEMAVTIGDTLDTQNPQLDRMNDKTDARVDELKRTNKRIDKMLY